MGYHGMFRLPIIHKIFIGDNRKKIECKIARKMAEIERLNGIEIY
jgi:hypothetical protein